MTDKSFDHKKAATIIIDMHTLVGLTANRARNAGVDKKKIDEIFDISASMTATLLATLHIDGDILNKILVEKLGEMEGAIDTSEDKEAISVAKANILGANNDASA
jgi:hypothetical protein